MHIYRFNINGASLFELRYMDITGMKKTYLFHILLEK